MISKKRLDMVIDEIKEDEVIRGAFMSLEDATQHRIDVAVNTAVEKKQIEIATKMLSLGLSIEDIIKSTGLSLDVIKSIKV